MKIPATVAVLTYNSGETLERALKSVKNFGQIIVCDGGSTDETLDIAKKYNAEIVFQGKEFKNEDGSIADFSGIRNQCLEAARHEWFLYVDSDEYIGDKLESEIADVVDCNDRGVFWTPRRYVFNEQVAECATTYPSYQVRFFHTSLVSGFIKTIHERIHPKEGVEIRYLTEYMYVPVDLDFTKIFKKWRYYLDLEARRLHPLSFRLWFRKAVRESLIGVLYFLRLFKVHIVCRGKKLPIRLEMMRVWYQYALVYSLLKTIKKW